MPTAIGTAAAGATAAGATAASRRLRIAATAMLLLSVLTPSGPFSVYASPALSAEEEKGGNAAGEGEGRAREDGQEYEDGGSGGGSGRDGGGGNGDSGDVGGPEAMEAADEARGEGLVTERREEEDQEKEDQKEEEERSVAGDEGNTAVEEDAAAAAAAAKDGITERVEASPALEGKQPQQEKEHRRRFKRGRQVKQAANSRRTGGGGAMREGGGTGGLLETDAANASTIADGRSSPGGGGMGGGAAAEGAVSELRSTEVRGELEVQEETRAEAGGRTEVCRATGPCVWCDKEDLHLDYCEETGRRQEVRCSAVAEESGEGDQNIAGAGAGAIGVLPSSVRYRSCAYAEEDDFQGLLRFSMAMAVLGVVACFGMRRRQEKSGSLYDRRAK